MPVENTVAEVAVAETQHPAAVAMVPEVMAILVLVIPTIVVVEAALETVVVASFCCM